MMNKKSRWLAAILSVMMVFCYMPSMAFAADAGDAGDAGDTDTTLTVSALADIEGFSISDDTISWDVFKGADGKEATKYKVDLYERAKNENYADWDFDTVIDSQEVTNEEIELEDDFDGKLNDDHEYMVIVTAIEGADSAATKSDDGDDNHVYYLYDEDATGDAVLPDGIVLSDTATNLTDSTNNVWGNLVIPKGSADEYVVTLYKSKTAITKENKDIDNAPTGAVKVTSMTLQNDDASDKVTYNFGDKMTYAAGSNQYNEYFVTITAKRSGMDDSDMYMSKSVTATNTIANDLDVPAFGGTFDSDGIVYFTNIGTNDKTGYDTIVLQLYKRVDGASAVKVGSPVVVDEDDDDQDDHGFSYKFKDLDQANTSYYVTAVAKAHGRGDSDMAYTKSYVLEDAAVEPESVDLDDDGVLTVELQKANGDEKPAKGYTLQLMYKGVNVGVEYDLAEYLDDDDTIQDADVTVKANLDMDKSGDVVNSIIDKAGYDIDDDYDNLSVKVKGYADKAADSAWVTSSNTADSPDNAKWDLTSKNNPVATWKAVDGADSYKVTLYKVDKMEDAKTGDTAEYSTNLDENEIDSLYTTKTSVDLSGLLDEDDNSAYLAFKVQSVKDGAKSSVTVSTTPNFDFDYKLDDVENVMWDGDKSTWDAVKGADSYSVSKMVNGKQVGPTKTVTTNEIQFSGLSNPGVYTFVVMANSNDDGVVSSTGMESDYKVIVAKQPGTFKITKATKTKTTVKLYWTASSNVDIYRIYKKVNGTYKVYIKEVRGTATAKTITGLKSGTANYFKVKAVNNGLYTFSNAKKATTLK